MGESAWPKAEPPAIPPGFPETYVPKRCWICGAWSNDESPYEQSSTEFKLWQGLLVWDQGTAEDPKGSIDRLCRTVWSVGTWPTQYKSMADLKQASRRDPTILHPFLAERAELVTIKQNNPNSRLMEKGLLAKRVSVNAADVAETGLEAPW